MNSQNAQPRTQTYLFALTIIFLVSGSFFHGFLFEEEYLVGAIVAFGVLSVLYFKHRILHDPALYFLLVCVCSYAVSLSYAINKQDALLEAIKIAFVAAIYLIFKHLNPETNDRALRVLLGTSFAAVVIGIAGDRFYDDRLAGFLDYANAQGLLLAVCSIIAQALYMTGRQGRYLGAHFAFVMALGLTQSRTAMLLWALSQIILYAAARKKYFELWLRVLIGTFLGIMGSVAFGQSVWATLLIIAISGVFVWKQAAFSVGLSRSVAAAAGVVAVTWAGWQLYDGGLSRWEKFGLSATEWQSRLVYYRDALRMSLDAVWTGYGGGGWAQLQYEYQSSDYFVRYVHNQLLQVATDTGLIGTVSFIGFVSVLLYRGFYELRNAPEERKLIQWGRLCASAAIVVHSLVDFVLAYPFLFGVFFLLNGRVMVPDEENRTENRRISGAFRIAGILLVSLIIMITSGLSLISGSYSRTASELLRNEKPADAVRSLDRSIKLALFADQAHDRKSKIYFQEYLQSRDQRYLAVAKEENSQALQTNPSQIWYLKLQSDILWEQGELEKSIRILEDLTTKNPFESRWREELKQRRMQLSK